MPRRELDGRKLAADVAKLLAADARSPPEAKPSLMDAMRSLVNFIEARAKLGWPDAMIARVLTEAGYPIEASTLRSYRKRMRDEGLMSPISERRAKSQRGSGERIGPIETAASSKPAPAETGQDDQGEKAIATPPPQVTRASADVDARPPASTLAPAETPLPAQAERTFRLNPAMIPRDRA